MSNSPLVNYTKISPNSSNPRNKPISKITIHHMAANLTVEQCGAVFAPASRQASSNYGIGTDGRVGLYVDEQNRAWTSSNKENDNMAVTIEVANDEVGGNWHVSDTALAKLIDLCTDICKRNGIKKLNFTGDKSGNLTMHKYFAATGCPGPYLESKFPYIADEVNKRLSDNAAKSENKEVLNMAQYEELKNEISSLKQTIEALKASKEKVYNYVTELPDWGKPTIEKLLAKGLYKGESASNLNLPENLLRTLVVNDRAGLYD
jgi:hypothetical protein